MLLFYWPWQQAARCRQQQQMSKCQRLKLPTAALRSSLRTMRLFKPLIFGSLWIKTPRRKRSLLLMPRLRNCLLRKKQPRRQSLPPQLLLMLFPADSRTTLPRLRKLSSLRRRPLLRSSCRKSQPLRCQASRSPSLQPLFPTGSRTVLFRRRARANRQLGPPILIRRLSSLRRKPLLRSSCRKSQPLRCQASRSPSLQPLFPTGSRTAAVLRRSRKIEHNRSSGKTQAGLCLNRRRACPPPQHRRQFCRP
ncbi:hypothetical protein GCAAIG_07615 [Candidatus Electronema halotolerans]